MTTVEYLEQIYETNDKGTMYLQEAERWREMASSVSVSYDKEPVKSSGNKQKIETMVTNAVYYEGLASEQSGKYFARRDKIVKQIIEMPGKDTDYNKILYKFYVENKHLSDIANEIGFCDSHTRRKYRNALKSFEKCYGNGYLNTNEQE